MDTSIASLTALSDSVVVEGLDRHIRAEKAETEHVIRHLAEVERRKLYAELGYASSFLYLTKACGYHAASAMRRIHAARAALKLPEVLDCLRSGELTLSSVSLLAGVIGKEKPNELLETFKGKTAREAEEIAASLKPVQITRANEKIVPVLVALKVDERQEPLPRVKLPTEPDENSNYFRHGSAPVKRSQLCEVTNRTR